LFKSFHSQAGSVLGNHLPNFTFYALFLDPGIDLELWVGSQKYLIVQLRQCRGEGSQARQVKGMTRKRIQKMQSQKYQDQSKIFFNIFHQFGLFHPV
jgi:hypothetical protein